MTATASSASDQYALAVVAWEALSGRAPFCGSSVTEVGRVKFVDPVPPLDAGVDGADALGPVLAKATAPHPADRFGSVVEFVAAWRTAVAGPDLVRTTGETGVPAVGRSVAETLASLGVTGVNPYKGLRSFQEADAGEFCGRAELVTHLVERVAAGPFVTVVGPSGSGKSSLVHAGVIPEFRRRGALVVSMVPGSHPLVELEVALRRVATVEDEATIGARLRTPGGLVAVARDLVAAGEQLVLVVDQFEELWTLVPDVAARDRFADLLAHAAGPQDVLRVVATLRADQYDLPLQHTTLGPVVSASTFAVTPMTAAELQDAIVVPAERVGVRFEPGLVSTMVGDVVSRPGALPLLQFTLTELFERRQNATVTTEAYEDLGGIGGALARRAEDLYEATAVEQRDDVHRLFTQLVTPGDDSDDLRRRATVEELADIAPRVIEEYRSNRLIVTDHHPVTREPTVEVAHEALLREWPRLAGWIDGDRDTIRVRRSLTRGRPRLAGRPRRRIHPLPRHPPGGRGPGGPDADRDGRRARLPGRQPRAGGSRPPTRGGPARTHRSRQPASPRAAGGARRLPRRRRRRRTGSRPPARPRPRVRGRRGCRRSGRRCPPGRRPGTGRRGPRPVVAARGRRRAARRRARHASEPPGRAVEEPSAGRLSRRR